MLEYDILDIRGNLTSVGQQQKKQQNLRTSHRDVPGHHMDRLEQGPDYADGGSKSRTMQMRWEQFQNFAYISEFRRNFRILPTLSQVYRIVKFSKIVNIFKNR